MAIRQKTVVFAFPTYTSVVANITVTNLTQITVYLPETVRRFVSCYVEVGFQDVITATGGSITEHRVGLQLAAAGYSTITELDDIANTAENIAGVMGPFDFTSYFTTNWSGSSMTCDLQVYFNQNTGTTTGMRNVTALLYVTYEYDDDPGVNATQIKTAILPLESLVGALTTTTNSNIGSNQIPQLTGTGGTLPEASVTISDFFFVIEGNEANNNATTDWTMSCNIDAGTAFAFGAQEAGLGSDRLCRWIYKPAVPTTTTTHSFQMWVSAGAVTRFNHGTVTLYVTYEFNASTTTRTLVTALMALEMETPVGTAADEFSRFVKKFFIEDPGTITMRQSAFRLGWSTTASVAGINARAGSQAFRAYTHVANVSCGMFELQQRIDSGSAQGSGITLARGLNELKVDFYSTDTTDFMTNVTGVVILNYECDVGADGIGQNTHTVFQAVSPWDALLVARQRVTFKFRLPEWYYWLIDFGVHWVMWSSVATQAILIEAEVFASENGGGGYAPVYHDAIVTDAELSCVLMWMSARDVFQRHRADPDDNRIDVEAQRDFVFFTSSTKFGGMAMYATYHSFVYEVGGDFGGTEAGDGSGVEVQVYRTDTRELVAEATSIVGGDFTAYWYDNVINVFAVAREDATHVGRSNDGAAVWVTTPTVNRLTEMLTLPTPQGLYLRSTATLNQSGGVVTSWTDSSGNGNSTTLAGTVGPDYEADVFGDGSGYGMEIAETDIGSGTTGRGGLRVAGIDYTSDAARRAFTAFAVFELRAFTVPGGCIIGFEAANWSVYEVNSGDLRFFYNSAEVSVSTLQLNRTYRLIVVSDTTANGGTKLYLDGVLVLSGPQCPAGLTLTDICFGSNNNMGANGLYSLRGAIAACGAFGTAFDGAQVAALDKLLELEARG